MRFTTFTGGFAAAVVAVSLLTPSAASAFDSRKFYDRHWSYDPYAYHYEHRGYYPYYGSDYWRPAHKVNRRRFRFKQPPYYKAWGYCKLRWEECVDNKHRKWGKFAKHRKHYK